MPAVERDLRSGDRPRTGTVTTAREDPTPHAAAHLPRHTDHETLRTMPRETLVHYLQQQLHVVSTLG